MSKNSLRATVMLLAAILLFASATLRATYAKNATASRRLGTVTGLVRDSKGQPLAGALIRFMREGAGIVEKQTSTAQDGTFVARVAPGKYLLTAVAEGFNSVSFQSVQVNPSDEISYRFNLEPLGKGRTAPERRADRNDPKWKLRSAANARSIFQQNGTQDASAEIASDAIAQAAARDAKDSDDSSEQTDADATGAAVAYSSSADSRARTHGVVETYSGFNAGMTGAPYVGTNFAVATPATDGLNLIFAGQLATNGLARLETTGKFRAGDRHSVSLTLGGATLPVLASKSSALGNSLGQVSVRAVDEWIVKDGIVVVMGLDYSRFLGARSGRGSLTPRIGFAYDANARTRLHAAYAPGAESRSQQSAATLEGGQINFPDVSTQTIALVDGRAVTERSHRLEFGVERVIDNSSSVEATAFFDATDGRGVGLMRLPVSGFSSADGAELLQVANQQGAARGLRVVYTRRVSHVLKTSAGYSFGRGQELATLTSASNPGDAFRSGFFQTVAAQIDSSFNTGTHIKTVLRFSPRASVFAIDPFAGQLAVFDPSLSILVTQELPTFGLPVRAQAIIDARNLFDVASSADDGETLTIVSLNRRSVRGGISLRF
ncbi:MAG: hypothetical protein QOE33_2415 [Acidobacteriota bacterium]|nr:hypothetical protein [Acidobacteriota bacterium]